MNRWTRHRDIHGYAIEVCQQLYSWSISSTHFSFGREFTKPSNENHTNDSLFPHQSRLLFLSWGLDRESLPRCALVSPTSPFLLSESILNQQSPWVVLIQHQGRIPGQISGCWGHGHLLRTTLQTSFRLPWRAKIYPPECYSMWEIRSRSQVQYQMKRLYALTQTWSYIWRLRV